MNPIETLVEEHETIVRMLDALESWSDAVSGDDAAERPELARFMTFIREFVDPIHHGKEEDLLFVTMVDHGFPKEHGPIGMMLHEHGIARGLIQTMHGLSQSPAPWTPAERDQAKRAAGAYAELMRQHIDKENHVLYPMAEARLPGSAMQDLAARFERFQASNAAHGAQLQALGEALIQQYAP